MIFLTKKFKCMVVGAYSIRCLAYQTDYIDRRCNSFGYVYHLTTNPYLIQTHAILDNSGVKEVLGFYIPFISISTPVHDGSFPEIVINYEKMINCLLKASFYPMLDETTRTMILKNRFPQIISLDESYVITKEVINQHYQKYLTLSHERYQYDRNILDIAFTQTVNRMQRYWYPSDKNLSGLNFNLLRCIPNCIYCGEIHEKIDK